MGPGGGECMTRSTWRSPLLALLATTAIIFAACGTAATPSPSAPASVAPTEQPSEEPAYDGIAYPESGEAPCGETEAPDADHSAYTGNFKKVTAVYRLTVQFDLCNPDVAFLSKIAFSAFGIHDADYLAAHAPDKSYLDEPNGTGPYMLEDWDKGNRLVLTAFEDYWGDAALTPGVEFRWSDQAVQRWTELQAGSVGGIDNPGADDIAAIKADSSVKFYPREGLNTFSLGFNDTIEPWTDVRVRQAIAMGINRQQI